MSQAAPDRSRRALLRGRRGGTAAMRPPWALAENDFLDACTRCADCVEACPEGILAKGDGGFPERLRTRGECTFCAACVEACAPRALSRDSGRAWDWTVRIDEACLAQAGIVCFACREACPERAIALPPRLGQVAAPVLDEARCSACGACVSICPAQAIALVEREGLPA